MIDPSEVVDYQVMIANLHDIDRSSLRNPLEYHFDPVEAATLRFLRKMGVLTVGDFLIWCTYYGPYHESTIHNFRRHIAAVFERLKD